MRIDSITTKDGIATIKIQEKTITTKVDKPLQVKDLEITSIKDCTKIKEVLKAINREIPLYKELTKQVPRPITIIAENDQHKIGLLSLNAKSIVKAVWANEQIHKSINPKLLTFKKELINEDTETVLNNIKKAQEKLKLHIDFKVQPVLICKEELKEELIEKHGICYVENAAKTKKEYEELNKNHQHHCFIAQEDEKIKTNARLLKDPTDILTTKKASFLHIETKEQLELATACNIPVIIYSIENKEIPKALEEITESIQSSN